MKKLFLLFLVFSFRPVSSFLIAETIINTEDHPEKGILAKDYTPRQETSRATLQKLKTEEKHLVRFEDKWKKMQASKKARKHSLNGFSDPVDKWFWIWVIGWGAGILITILSGAGIFSGFLGILWFSLFIIGSVALVIWLIKKFGN
jgi:hypothetical protein